MKWRPKWLQLPEPESSDALQEAEAAHKRAQVLHEEAKDQVQQVDQAVRAVNRLKKSDNFSKAMEMLFKGGHA